jgi:hypothetical protein
MPDKLDFLTPTTLKVLKFFFANSMAEFHEREDLPKGKGEPLQPEERKKNLVHHS